MSGPTTSAPEQDLGFEAEPVVPVPPEGVLPATGSGKPSELAAIAVAIARSRRDRFSHRSKAKSRAPLSAARGVAVPVPARGKQRDGDLRLWFASL